MNESAERLLVHGTCVALDLSGSGADWCALLLRGPSGVGKSDLALRLIEAGWRLVADDQCLLERREGVLFVSAPETIAGKIEARGVGVLSLASALPSAPLLMVVDLVEKGQPERLPEPANSDLLGLSLPRLSLSAFDVSVPAKLRLAMQQTRGGRAFDQSDEAPQEVPEAERRRVVLVTGLSGAGRSTALNALEDLGYEVIDNLPLELVEWVLAAERKTPIALGIDIRTRNFAVGPFLELFDRLRRDRRRRVELLFLTCDEDVLARRFSETRRRHPLAQDRPLIDGLVAERRLVMPLRARAEPLIDTTALSPGELRRILDGHFRQDAQPGMSIVVVSFSYKLGVPRAADLVIDARFLKNPYYDPELRPLTGKDARVAAHVRSDPDYEAFYGRLKEMLLPLVPRYAGEGKSYLTLAFGCTGGRHRSVALAEAVAQELQSQGYSVTLAHRDLERAKIEDAPPGDMS